MIYLASPYSHPHTAIREQRFWEACRTAAALMRMGYVVYAPIVHGHPLTEHGVPGDWRTWERSCREHLVRCDEVVVLTLAGWRESAGVATEVGMAGKLGIPIRYLAPEARAISSTLAHVAEEAGP